MVKCSVIIPVYNAEKFIQATVDSVLCQTYTEFEIILIDDCSTDKSFQICTELKDLSERIRVYKNHENQGVSYTRNFGGELANGEWICFLDADDIWKPEKLEKQMEIVNKVDAQFLFTACDYIDETGRAINYIFHIDNPLTYKMLLRKNQITCSSVMMKKELFKKYNMKKSNVQTDIHEDYLCWLEILKEIKIAYGVDEPLVSYRLLNNSRSSNKRKGIRKTYNVFRMHGFCCLKSAYFTLKYCLNGLIKYSQIKKCIKKGTRND